MTVRVLAFLSLGLFLIQGCGSPTANTGSSSFLAVPLQVVVTMSILLEPVAKVGGDHVEVESIVPIGGDPHSYEPVPNDAIKIADADLVVDNGLGLSPWFEGSLEENVTGHLLRLSEHVAHDMILDHYGRPDPHLWMSPIYMAQYASVIAQALAALDPVHARDYHVNATAYHGRLDILDQEIAEILDMIPVSRRLLVTHENAYNHFARQYKFDIVGTIVGATTEEEPSARDMRRLVDEIHSRDVCAVFPQVALNPAVMEQLSRNADVMIGQALYVDSLGAPGSGAETYMDMMRFNARAIVAGLGDCDG